ncbi:MAG TPA: orotidine-5'-phosphate decarboxylase [Phycisphaerae bacterium]|nr:orotidine-5'-phosphate decarboxylase [Phycisphaerae bacterium]
MPDHFADRLLAAIDQKGSPVCVGLDPAIDRIPPEVAESVRDLLGEAWEEMDDVVRAANLIYCFCLDVIGAVADLVPAVKPQIAYFERYGAAGVAMYEAVVSAAREAGLIVIGDVKRGDIGSTAAQYAAGHLAIDDGPDAITVNGYFGADGLMPFVEAARDNGKGLFVLVRTSNPSARQIQDFADAAGKTVFQHAAECVAELGAAEGLIGESGYSCVGAVVGATYPDEARLLRKLMPRQIFLVPGYGAQGATAADCAASFDEAGRGAIVNASRSVIYAHQLPEYAGMEWPAAVRAAAESFAADIAKAVKP